MQRRDFLKQTGVAAGLGLTGISAGAARGVVIVADPADAIAASKPARWAAAELQTALSAKSVSVRLQDRIDPAADFTIVATGAGSPRAQTILAAARVSIPAAPESLGLLTGRLNGRPVLLACGHDERGLVYALSELADRVRHAEDPFAALAVAKPIVEQPANRIRAINRAFVSDVEDLAWYRDRAEWSSYLSMLASQRFNRFSLAFGIGYDFTRQIRDCYFHFPYPFLLSVPGYSVRAVGLPDAERDRNFELLRFISEETATRGLHFQLAIWTHAYRWTDSPKANYTIEGLTPETHAAYCRDGLRQILEACPAIGGVTFRTHGESGVAEGDYQFWRTVFDGMVKTGRKLEIDLHAKGIDQTMIAAALGTGFPVTISPKLCAEHMGLPYHQARIRELEMPPRERKDEGFFALSNGSRSFMRYSYGDLLAEDRRYGVLFRVWPGTQRMLLWGDPAMAAGYSRAFQFCGSSGAEICEPLFFKGRKGGGLPGGRSGYADTSLEPRYDWEKFLQTYRLWGHHLYNPSPDPDVWRRPLRAQFGNAASAAEAALSNASRILPLITSAHGASAANNNYWPEMYTNMSIVDAAKKHPYGDTPSPKRFGTVSPFDPELFAGMDEFADALLSGERGAKYSPLEVADWLDEFAAGASRRLADSDKSSGRPSSPEYRRMAIDVAIQAGLGRFFAAKFRSGVLWAIFTRTGHAPAGQEALAAYRLARDSWSELAKRASGVYRADISFGYDSHVRGHWSDRLPAIDEDIAEMEKLLARGAATGPADRAAEALRLALAKPQRPVWQCRHSSPVRFQPGQPLELRLSVENRPAVVELHYRRVNQSERWQVARMERIEQAFQAKIPADYTNSPFPVQYYFELRDAKGIAGLYPGFQPELSNQPYFVVRARA